MALRLGKYAASRPETLPQYSSEYKRDLMDEKVDIFGSSKHSKSKNGKKRSSRDSEITDESDNERKRKKPRRQSGDKTKQKSRNDSSRRKSRDSKSKKRQRTPSPNTPYDSPDNVSDDSDLESNGLDMGYDLEPLIHHLHLDRELFNKQIFKIIRGKRRRHLLPKILKDVPDKELKLLCLSELAQWSNKRIRVLMKTGILMKDDENGALIDTKKIFAERQKRDEEAARKEQEDEEKILNGTFNESEASATKEPEIPEEKKSLIQAIKATGDLLRQDDYTINDSTILKQEKSSDKKAESESEEEDIEMMRKTLIQWRAAKWDTELTKLKNKQKDELEQLQLDLQKEIDTVNRKREEKELNNKRLEELNAEMNKVEEELAKEKGLILVKKHTIQKVKNVPVENVEEEPEKEKDEDDSEASSLDMKDAERSEISSVTGSNQKPDDISLADSPSKQRQVKTKKIKKERKPKGKKGKRKDEAPDARPNLCPDVPYKNSKKDKRRFVRDWLANIGKDGPPLPVPDENYYPDYCDPNAKNAEKELEAIQEAYEIKRAKAGRTDGKNITTLKGEAVFEDEELDETLKTENSVAKRMLTTMLNRGGKSEIKVKHETDSGAKNYGPKSTMKTEALGAIYQRHGDEGQLKFAKDVQKEQIIAKKVKKEEVPLNKYTRVVNAAGNANAFTNLPVKSDRQLKREAQQKKETEMRAKAIKSMMEKMKRKKVKQEKDDAKAADDEGKFPWQDDYVDDDEI